MTSLIARVATAYINNGPGVIAELRMEQEFLTVSSYSPRPDPNWSTVDEAGHFHAFDKDEQYPTLEILTRHEECTSCGDDDCDGITSQSFECRICRVEVKPGLLHGEHTANLPGLKSWTVVAQTLVVSFDPVSVRVVTEPLNGTAGGLELFGVAQVTDMSGGSDPNASRTTLVGVGALGRRTARALAGTS